MNTILFVFLKKLLKNTNSIYEYPYIENNNNIGTHFFFYTFRHRLPLMYFVIVSSICVKREYYYFPSIYFFHAFLFENSIIPNELLIFFRLNVGGLLKSFNKNSPWSSWQFMKLWLHSFVNFPHLYLNLYFIRSFTILTS